jgi:hypothetical protein
MSQKVNTNEKEEDAQVLIKNKQTSRLGQGLIFPNFFSVLETLKNKNISVHGGVGLWKSSIVA